MRAVLQRVKEAKVTVNGAAVGSIEQGWLVLLGVEQDDQEADVIYLANKTSQLRGFSDRQGKMNLSVKDVGGGILVVSQFTLAGDCRKGLRPSFTSAAGPETARQLYEQYVTNLRAQGLSVATGQFQADMDVALINDGPVTFLLDSKKTF